MQALAPLRYLIRPLQIEGALFIAVIGVLLGLARIGGLAGLSIAVAAATCLSKYAFIFLDHLADGKPGGPIFSWEMANPAGEARPWLYLVSILVFVTVTELLSAVLGATWVFALRLLCICLLPAFIAVHSITGSFIEALNPAAVIAMAWRMGWGYLCVLAVAVVCLVAMQLFVLPASSEEEPGLRVLTLQFMPHVMHATLLAYLWLAMFAVLGGTLFEFRNEIGYDAAHSPERKQARVDAEQDVQRNQFIDRVFGEYRSGAYINAWNSIQERVRASEDALAEYRWVLERIATWPSPRLANRMVQEMLPLLLAKRLSGEALGLVKNRLKADQAFRPATGEYTLKMAQLACDGGDRPLARALLQDFERYFPDDPVRGSVVHLSAQLAR